jgi:hypothetical protein
MHRIRYLIGALTLLAAAAGAIQVVRILQNLDDRPGLPLRVEFRDARGLRAGADVRYRGVTVGTVRSVSVVGDGGKAVAGLLLDPAGAAQVCVNSSFWIVTPRFGGLTGGATGLDTLVRDAYLTFQTPAERGSPLAAGSQVIGRERPPASLEPDSLEDIEPGDLLMTLLVPENHGLRPGSAVVFRGTQTGDVRSVELAKDGTHVEVTLRIARRHRQTVTDRSKFWVARPSLTGALFSGFAVTDLNALLSPFVSYYGEPGLGLLVQDGYRAAAEAARPAHEVSAVPAEALRQVQKEAQVAEPDLVLVRVVYSAIEQDTWSANDAIQRDGTGVLFKDRLGRTVVVTARSIVDGSYTEKDVFGGDPDIADEQFQVMLSTGVVLRAARVWVDGNGVDMAALLLDEPPAGLPSTPKERLDFGTEPRTGVVMLRRVGPDGLPLAPVEPVTDEAGRLPASLADHRGGALTIDGRVIGISGQLPEANEPERASVVPLRLLPTDLRPE